MAGQNQIRRRLSNPHSVERVRQLIAENPDIHRTELADRLCDELCFVDARGRRQRSGCLKALRLLESRGRFKLPEARRRSGRPQPRRLRTGVPAPENVPDRVGKIRGLELVLVETEEQRRIWNTLFLDEHPRGASQFVGRQLRYLINSEHGWLGGVGFASAALQLNERDRWIGWDHETRQSYLDRIVAMNRFLIRPSVRCRNLASHVLSKVMARMPQDFHERYGYSPWLVETFVDTSRSTGSCYRAANWTRVGSTLGRGRQDSERKQAETVKDIYVQVLVDDFRGQLPTTSGLVPLPLDAGLERGTWAEQEFGGAPVGDQRLSQRLIQSAAVQCENPSLSFPGAAGGDTALIKGYYRLIDQPDGAAVTMENILLPHREQTMRRMAAHKTALCIQDGTDLDYNGIAECQGLGIIGTNQTGAQSQGLHMHSTIAVTDDGLPLGSLKAQCWAPEPKPDSETRDPKRIPVEEKPQTYAWIVAMRDCEDVASRMPDTRIFQVMDRGADIFELFDEWRAGPRRTHLLVRAEHNRATMGQGKLFDSVKGSQPRLVLQLHIERQSARPKKSKQQARPARPGRTAEITVRYQKVELRPPDQHRGKAPIPMWIVHLLEESPPEGVKPIEWFLLTTAEVSTPEQAECLSRYYALRWRIEDWHRVLKTGCRIEDLRNESAERLKRSVAIYLVIAWRIMLMTLLGRRDAPELPPTVLFSDLEVEVLTAWAKSRRDLKPPACLGDAVRLLGRLGGHMGRKNDPPPGHQVLWIGYGKLQLMCAGYLLACSGTDPP